MTNSDHLLVILSLLLLVICSLGAAFSFYRYVNMEKHSGVPLRTRMAHFGALLGFVVWLNERRRKH